MRRVLRDILHLDLSAPEEDAIASAFNEQRDVFYRWSLFISSWIVCARRYGAQVHAANVEMGDLFEVSPELTLQRRPVGRDSYLRAKCSVPSGCTWREVLSVARELRSLPPKTHVRGKFDLWFLITFLHRLPSVLEGLYGKSMIRVKTQLTRSNAVEILGPRLGIPVALRSFLAGRLSMLAEQRTAEQ